MLHSEWSPSLHPQSLNKIMGNITETEKKNVNTCETGINTTLRTAEIRCGDFKTDFLFF